MDESLKITENIYIDLDAEGNLVSMTIEHVKASSDLWEFSYQENSRQSA